MVIIDDYYNDIANGDGNMKTMTVTSFKSHALQVLGSVASRKERVVVTKRGKPLAEVVPYTNDVPKPGRLADALVFEKDILSPMGEDMWDAST